MKVSPRFPVQFWRLMSRLNRGMLAQYESKGKVANRVLVLRTIGRKSGQVRATPLQYEQVDDTYYVASARGVEADWYRNLLACSNVQVQVGEHSYSTVAQPMTDPVQIADFLELRLKRHPLFMGVMLKLEGLPRHYTRGDLEKLARRLAIVALPVDKVK